MIKKYHLKERFLEYALNYTAYIVCVVVISLLLGREINVKMITIMAIFIIFSIELYKLTQFIYQIIMKKLKNKK